MMSSFSKQIELFANDLKGKIDNVVSETRIGVAESVINKTPVDTGYARGNWQASIGEPITTQTKRFDYEAGFAPTVGAGPALREAGFVAEIFTNEDFYITNNAEYINDLEFGNVSNQAPSGMVRVTVANFSSIVGDAVKKVVK